MSSTTIDCDGMIEFFAAQRRLEGDRRRARLRDVHLEHMRAELVDHDIDRLMGTMVPDPVFHFYGTEGMPAVEGGAAVRSFYLNVFEAPPGSAGMEVERFTVGDEALVLQCHLLMAKQLTERTFPGIAELIDPTRDAMLRKRACIVLPFEGDKIQGEYHYFDGPYTTRDIVYLD